MKRILLLTILLFTIKSFGQDENQYLKSAKVDFEKLSADFEKKEKEVKANEEELKVLLDKIKSDPNPKYSEELTKKMKEVYEQKATLSNFCEKYEGYKVFYLDKGITAEQINDFFKHKCVVSAKGDVAEEKQYKTYLYYGDDLIIEELKPTGDKKTDDILKKILSTESNSYLGDIIIPSENQEFYFYKTQKNDSKKKVEEIFQDTISIEVVNSLKLKKTLSDTIDIKGISYKRLIKGNDTFYVKIKHAKNKNERIARVYRLNEKYKLKRVSFEICDGFFTDIKVFVLDKAGSEYLFENNYPISILDYSDKASEFFLFYKHRINQVSNNGYKNFEDFRIKLSDVLVYVSKPGYNYIPNDVVFDLPTKDQNGQNLNKYQSVKYEIKENTTLQNVIELRAYTDFLGLFTDSANGLVQLQGKGDFYIFPRLTPFRGDLRVLDKISPYVNFSRLDADVRGVETTFNSSKNKDTINNSTDLLQKAYLEMGAKLNLINWKFEKSVPFRLIGYFPFRYQIADVKIADELKNVQGLGLGLGCTFEFKRFNNFGFNYSLEFSKYSYIDYNNIPELELPGAYSVFRNEAEIFYHPDSDKKQAIFLRLKTFNNTTNHDAFYQLQFGYRFSIGISEVKAKTQ